LDEHQQGISGSGGIKEVPDIISDQAEVINIYSSKKIYFKPHQISYLTVHIKPPFPEVKTWQVELYSFKVKNLQISNLSSDTSPKYFQYDSQKKELSLKLEVRNCDAQRGCMVDAKEFVGTAKVVRKDSMVEENKSQRKVRNEPEVNKVGTNIEEWKVKKISRKEQPKESNEEVSGETKSRKTNNEEKDINDKNAIPDRNKVEISRAAPPKLRSMSRETSSSSKVGTREESSSSGFGGNVDACDIRRVRENALKVYSLKKIYFKPLQISTLTVYIKPPFPKEKNLQVELLSFNVRNLQISSRFSTKTFHFDSQKKEMTLTLDVKNRDTKKGCMVDAKEFVGTVKSVMKENHVEEDKENSDGKDGKVLESSKRGSNEWGSKDTEMVPKRTKLSEKDKEKKIEIDKKKVKSFTEQKTSSLQSCGKDTRCSKKSITESVKDSKGRKTNERSTVKNDENAERKSATKRRSSESLPNKALTCQKRVKLDKNGFDTKFTSDLFPDDVSPSFKKREIHSFEIIAAEDKTLNQSASVICEIKQFKAVHSGKTFTPIQSEKNLIIINQSYEVFNSKNNALVKVVPTISNLIIKAGDLLGKCIIAGDSFPLQLTANHSLTPGGTAELKANLGGNTSMLKEYSDVVSRNLHSNLKISLNNEKLQIQKEDGSPFITVQVKNLTSKILHLLAGQVVGEAVKVSDAPTCSSHKSETVIAKKTDSVIGCEIAEELTLTPNATEPTVLFKVRFPCSTIFDKPVVNAGKLVVSTNAQLSVSCSPQGVHCINKLGTEYFLWVKLTNYGKESLVIKKEDKIVKLLLDNFYSFDSKIDLDNFVNLDFSGSDIFKASNSEKSIFQPRSKVWVDFEIANILQKKSDFRNLDGKTVFILKKEKRRRDSIFYIIPQKTRITDGKFKVLVKNVSEFEQLVSESESTLGCHLEVFVIMDSNLQHVDNEPIIENELEKRRAELEQATYAYQLALDGLPVSPPGEENLQ